MVTFLKMGLVTVQHKGNDFPHKQLLFMRTAQNCVSCSGHISAITRLQLTQIRFNKTSCLFCM